MLRINLLPAYIAERRKTKMTIVGFAAGFLAVTAALLAFFFVQKSAVEAREAEANAEEVKATEVTAIRTKTVATRGEVQPILNNVDFVEAVLFYNTLRSKIFRQAAAYTYREVEYSSMAVQGQTLSINAFAKNVGDVGRFLITMFGNPDLQAVSVSGVPGWPANQTGGAGGGFPGGPGGPAGFGGGGPEGFPGGPGGPGGFPGGGGIPGDVGGFGGEGGGFGGTQIPARPGFPFTVTATLIKPVAAPQPPTQQQQGGQFGPGGGGFPGGPEGFPGGPGGFPGGPGDVPGGPPSDVVPGA